MGMNLESIKQFFYVEPHERLKLFFLGTAYFLVITAYTIAKELKDSVFMSIVGKSYIPMAKILAIIVLIPAIFLYSKLVDKMRRYYLLCFYSAFFGIVGILFAILLSNQTIGLPNTNTSPYRIFGWLFYFFVEGYTPFLVSVFWAFANSVNSPESAKKNYGLMVSASKLGGMLSAGLAWYLFTSVAFTSGGLASDIFIHQIVLGFSSAMLLLVPVVISLLMKKVSGQYLHGYEAAYRVEKQKGKEGKAETGILAGVTMLIKYPYVLGIFGMVFFYEVGSSVLSYLRLGVAQSNATSLAGVSGILFQITFMYQFIGFFISLLGTAALMRTLGERLCLLLIPIVSGVLLVYMIFSNASSAALIVAFVVMKAVNYAFAWPVRESLYIPTVKEIKFKSKSWIDAFGSKFAKGTGSSFNIFAEKLGSTLFLPVHALFFAILIGFWFVTAWLLGYRYDKAIARNEVIGAEEEPERKTSEAA